MKQASTPGLRRRTLSVAVALGLLSQAWAARAQINPATTGLPMGGVVAAGTVTADLAGTHLALTQASARAVIDWQSFNIAAGHSVQFVQPGASAAVLNRVAAGSGLSEIAGSLSANGMVLLMNPDGVLLSAGATVNVGALIAGTGVVGQAEFMAGGQFTLGSAVGGSVVNQGSITAAEAGLVALVAPAVANQGSILASGGRIVLAGADRATVSLNGGLYEFAVPAGALGTNAQIANSGSLQAAHLLLSTGDAADLVSGVINLQGVQQASSAIVVDGHAVLLASDLDAPMLSGHSASVQVQPGVALRDAVQIARSGGATVQAAAGEHSGALLLDKPGLTLAGEPGARLRVADNTDGITIAADDVTVQGLEIAGPVDAPYTGYAWGGNVSRGVRVADGVTGFVLQGNVIRDLRNGILVHGRNSSGRIEGNVIDNTKSGISVQYTDAAGITIAGNAGGAHGNEWGLNLHLNGHLDGGGSIVGNSQPIAAAPTLAWQQALLDLSTANNGWSVQDQAYTASNRTHVYVAGSGAAGHQGSRLAPIDTVQGGINAVVAGGRVDLAAGTYTQASTLNVGKPLTLAGAGQATTVLDARAITGGYGMSVSADDVTLQDFTFHGPSAFYASAYGIKVSPGGGADARLRNFTICNVTSRGAGKAELDLNGVDGALIEQVTLDGAPVGNDAGTSQGAGLQLTDSANVTVRDTTTRHNAWGGVAIYQANRSYNQRVDNIRIEGANPFQELNPVYLQDESALHDFGSLNIAGFAYAVRNIASAGSAQYTWLQAQQQQAYDFAVNLPGAGASFIQGWNGAGTTQGFEVGVGQLQGGGTQAMSIATAIAQSGSGASIRVGAGSYAESVSLDGARDLRFSGATLQDLTLRAGAAGSGIGGQVTASGAGGINFEAPVRLLADTTLATAGGPIRLSADIQNSGSTPRALTLMAGAGSSRGDVQLATGGAAGNPLGRLTVLADRFTLDDTLWVTGYAVDALGDVALSSNTLRALDPAGLSTLVTGGNLSGSTVSQGNVTIVSSGSVQLVLDVRSATVQAAGPVLISGTAQRLSVDAPSGQVSGSFAQVDNAGDGLFSVNGRPALNATLEAHAGNNRVLPGRAQLAGASGEELPARQLVPAPQVAALQAPVRSSPAGASIVIDRGQTVEIDLTPGNETPQ